MFYFSSSVKTLPVLEPGDKLLIVKPVIQLPENTKLNSPTLERKSVLGKWKTKGKDFMYRITSNDGEETNETTDEIDHKNMLFTQEELTG